MNKLVLDMDIKENSAAAMWNIAIIASLGDGKMSETEKLALINTTKITCSLEASLEHIDKGKRGPQDVLDYAEHQNLLLKNHVENIKNITSITEDEWIEALDIAASKITSLILQSYSIALVYFVSSADGQQEEEIWAMGRLAKNWDTDIEDVQRPLEHILQIATAGS